MNQGEVKSVVAFCKLCDRLAASTFGRPFKVAFCKTYRVQSNSSYSTRVQKFNEDAFRSFLIDFRKLVLEKETTNLYRVLNILGRYGDSKDQTRIKQIKAELQNISESIAGVRCGVSDKNGHYRSIQPKEVLLTYFNGVLFHNDETLIDKIKFFDEAGIFALHGMLHYIIFIHKQALRLAGSIRLRGIV